MANPDGLVSVEAAANYRSPMGGARPPTAEELGAVPVFNVEAFRREVARPLTVADVVTTQDEQLARLVAAYKQKFQMPYGTCTGNSIAWSGQRAILLRHNRFLEISAAFAYWVGSYNDTTFRRGSSVSYVGMQSLQLGNAREELFSQEFLLSHNGEGLLPADLPKPNVYADALTHKSLEVYRLDVMGPQRAVIIRQLLDAGYGIGVALGNHAFSIGAYVTYGSAVMYPCMDSMVDEDLGFGRGCKAYYETTVINNFYDITVVKTVDVSATAAPPSFPPPDTQPPTPPTGNTQMLIDQIKADAASANTAANGLVLGAITQAQVDAINAAALKFKNDAATLVADAAAPNPNPTPTPQPSAGNVATFLGTDATTHGKWKGVYGADGYYIVRYNQNKLPAYATLVPPNGVSPYEWDGYTVDPRGLARPPDTMYMATCWYAHPAFSVDLNLADGNLHKVSAYVLDWDRNGRSMRVEVLDATTKAVLSTQDVAQFQDGKWLSWKMSGHVLLRFTNLLGTSTNAVVSGIYFDAAGG